MINRIVRRQFNSERALILCLPLSAISNLLQNLPGFSQINQLFVLLYASLLLLWLIRNALNRTSYIEILFGLLLTCLSIAMTTWPFNKSGTIPYYVLCLLSLVVFSQNPNSLLDEIDRSQKYLRVLLFVWCAIVAASVPFASSWQISETGQKYFVSITGSPFQLMPTALMMTAVAGCLLRISSSKPVLFSLAVPFYVAFSSGSRTYFALISVVLLITLARCVTGKGMRLVIFCALLIVGLGIYSQSGASKKFGYVTGQGLEYSSSLINSITSGRWDMWRYEVKSFASSDIFHQLLGNGFDHIYQVNRQAVGVELWAHNDFLNILITYGVIGLTLYLIVCMSAVYVLARRLNLSKSMVAVLFLVWLFNAIFNMFYTYMCAFLSFPIVAICLSDPVDVRLNLDTERKVA